MGMAATAFSTVVPDNSILSIGQELSRQFVTWDDEQALARFREQICGTLLEQRLASVAPELLGAILRAGAGLSASPQARAVGDWISENPGRWGNILHPHASQWPRTRVVFGGNHSEIAQASARQDREKAQQLYNALMRETKATLAVGDWMEHRSVYTTDNYKSLLIEGARRDHHLGCDFFAPALTSLFMPMVGEIVQAGIMDERLDYGGFIVTRHELTPQTRFFALWGHLSHASVRRWARGQTIAEGVQFAELGDFEENGWWLPHLHLQLSTLEFHDFCQMPGVGEGDHAKLWQEIFPDPTTLVLG